MQTYTYLVFLDSPWNDEFNSMNCLNDPFILWTLFDLEFAPEMTHQKSLQFFDWLKKKLKLKKKICGEIKIEEKKVLGWKKKFVVKFFLLEK